MSANGNPYATIFDYKKPVAPESVRDARRRLRLAETGYRLKRLEKLSELVESVSTQDFWITVLNDRLERLRDDPWLAVATSRHDRRYGRNYPIFRTEIELGLMRMQSRILCAVNSYAIGLLEGLQSYIVDTGMTYTVASKHKEQPAPDELIDACQDVIDGYLERNHWFGGTEPGLEDEFVWRASEDGEVFLLHFPQEDGATEVRVIEPEQVTQPPASGDDYLFGICNAPGDVQKPTHYALSWGDTSNFREYTPEDMLHYRANSKRGIKRGIPDFTHETLDAFHVAGKLCRNMALGAAIQATYAGVREHDTATREQVLDMQALVASYTQTDPLTGEQQYVQKHEPGMVEMPAGSRFVTPPTAQNAAAHVEILLSCLRKAGRRWCAPDWLIAGDASNNPYASSLVAESPFVKRIGRAQNQYGSVFRASCLIALRNKCREGLRVLLVVRDGNGEDTGQRRERLFSWDEVQELIDLTVKGKSAEARDKTQEAQQNQIYLQGRVKSPQTVQQELGLDPETEEINWQEVDERQGGAGLPLGMPGEGGGQPEQGQPEQGQPEQPPALPGMEALTECGGEGGKPGPCPDNKGKDKKEKAAKKIEDKPPKVSGKRPEFKSDKYYKERDKYLDHLEKLKGNDSAVQKFFDDHTELAGYFDLNIDHFMSQDGPPAPAISGSVHDSVIAGMHAALAKEPAAGMATISTIRDQIGSSVSREEFDNTVLDLWRQGKIRMIEISDLGQTSDTVKAGAIHVYDNVRKADRLFGYIEPKVPVAGAKGPVGEALECDDQPTPLRESVLLDLSDIRQVDFHTCGVAALQAVLDYFGISTTDDEIAAACGTTEENGTEPGPMEEYARQQGLSVEAGPMDMDGLRSHLQADRPVICAVQYDAPDGWAAGHYVVAAGISGEGDDAILTLQDPARGRVRELASEFVRRWHDLRADGSKLEQYGIAVGHGDAAPTGGKGKGCDQSKPVPKESPESKRQPEQQPELQPVGESHLHLHFHGQPADAAQIEQVIRPLLEGQRQGTAELVAALRESLAELRLPEGPLTQLLEQALAPGTAAGHDLKGLADAILKLAERPTQVNVQNEIKLEPDPAQPLALEVTRRDAQGRADRIDEVRPPTQPPMEGE